HMNFAPVLDVNSQPANPIIGARAFGESPELVEALGTAYIDGLQAAGVAATAKHFPGHGDVTVDSHLDLPRVEHDLDRLLAVELRPFASAARAGVAAVMTAHIVHPAVDPSGVPATMSTPMLTGVLRERLGYRGLVLTDSMSMRAIVDHFGVGEAAVLAVAAGCDVILALGPEALQREIIDHLAEAIDSGRIPGNRVAEAVDRLAGASARWGLARPHDAGPHPRGEAGRVNLTDVVGTDEHLAVARRIAEAAITLVRDRAGVIPLKDRAIGLLPVTPKTVDDPTLATALRRRGARARGVEVGDDLSSVDLVIAVTCTRGAPRPSDVATVRNLHGRLGDRLIVVATGDPYDVLSFPDVPAYVATYGTDSFTLEATARVLLGEIPPSGRLPVTLPGLHLAGQASTPNAP
ncbi:MAG: glycoside hydrolase family 3 protein, partial [Anaerolineales bacterium]